MTEWQWQVILALCRMVLRSYNHDRTGVSYREQYTADVAILKEAVNREIT